MENNEFDFDIMNPCGYKNGDTRFVIVLKAVMFAKNLNQLQLAELIGIRQSQVSNWLNNKSLPNYTSLQFIKDKLNVSIEMFFE